MSDKDIQKRKNQIQENLGLFWNSYQHMYDVRERNIQESINFLLVITTFLSIACITLYTTSMFQNLIILIPVVFQFVALLILFRSFFIKGQMIPWLELKTVFESFKQDDSASHILAILKASESDTYTNMAEKSKIIKHSLRFILFSLYAMLLAVIFVLLEVGIFAYVLVLIITAIFAWLILSYYSKPVKFNFDKNYPSIKSKIEKWIQEGKNE